MTLPLGIHPRDEQVVEVFSSTAYGSGYRISDRLIITAGHLFQRDGDQVQVRLRTGSLYVDVPAEILWLAASPDVDIALLRLESTPTSRNVVPVVLGDLR